MRGGINNFFINFFWTKNPHLNKKNWGGQGGGWGRGLGLSDCFVFDKLTKNPNLIFFVVGGGWGGEGLVNIFDRESNCGGGLSGVIFFVTNRHFNIYEQEK